MNNKKILAKPIKGFPDYFVTATGDVISRKRGCERTLKPTTTNDGHLVINLSKDRKSRSVLVHRLVLEAFRGPPPTNKHQVRHRDGDPINNRIENLEWGTCKENHADRKRHKKGRESELTDDEVREIRELGRSDGGRSKLLDFKSIGRMYGISARNAARIAQRSLRADVPDFEIPNFADGVLVVCFPVWRRKKY